MIGEVLDDMFPLILTDSQSTAVLCFTIIFGVFISLALIEIISDYLE